MLQRYWRRIFVQREAGREFDDFLVAALDRAIAFEEMDDVAVPVAEDLDFQMLRADHALFDEAFAVAERGSASRCAAARNALHLRVVLDDADAAAAAAVAGLHHDGVAALVRRTCIGFVADSTGRSVPGMHGQAELAARACAC